MPEALSLTVAGRSVQVPAGASVLAALQTAGVLTLRHSLNVNNPSVDNPSAGPRGALCGMGSCFECRALVDGVQVRTCLTPAHSGMTVTLLDGEDAR
ncbi:2Fe-2S iron-sulfur cluster-binding protein [Deinococcus rubellus]|uniref:(2Fe-2S)-binding protein n=1 Tax=Deinococcus rubellus TaxID=1889240 RepID=UPI0031EB370E